jgi:hypothetical protein
MATAREKEKRYEEIRKSLSQLDLHQHSLKNAGQKLVSEASGSPAASSGATYEQSLQLSKDCLRIISYLGDHLDKEDLNACQSALDRVDLAVQRASQAKTPTLCMVNVWRVIEAAEQFLVSIADKYDYVRLSEETALEAIEGEETQAADLAKLFEEYEEAMAAKMQAPKPAGPPFSYGVLHWRGSQLFYIESVEDGVRWIELDPSYETENIDLEEGAELLWARTIDGYEVMIRLDIVVDDNEVDNYIVSQEGSEYFVSGFQLAAEQGQAGSRKGRRR